MPRPPITCNTRPKQAGGVLAWNIEIEKHPCRVDRGGKLGSNYTEPKTEITQTIHKQLTASSFLSFFHMVRTGALFAASKIKFCAKCCPTAAMRAKHRGNGYWTQAIQVFSTLYAPPSSFTLHDILQTCS